MAVATNDAVIRSTAVQPRPHLFTIDEYVGIVNSGILGPDIRVELIEGQIVEMPPIGDDHMWGVNSLNVEIGDRRRCIPHVQNPIRLPDGSMPQPDFAALRLGTARHAPLPQEILLVAEVADTSLSYDRQTKGPLYAQAGIPEYWIVDLNGDRIEVYSEPSPTGYRSLRPYARGESISPAFAPDLVIEVDAILGPVEPAGAEDQPSGADAPADG